MQERRGHKARLDLVYNFNILAIIRTGIYPIRLTVLCLVFYWHSIPTTSGQKIAISSLDMSQDIGLWYDSLAGIENTGLILGILADTEIKAQDTHPYFEDFRWQAGSVVYRGEQFENATLLYNLETDVLLTRRNGLGTNEQYLQLNSKQVSYFKIGNAKFKRIDTQLSGHSTGFYEELFEGDYLLLVTKHTKLLEINASAKFEFNAKDEFFIYYKGQYFLVKHSRDLAKILKPYRKDIKSFAKLYKVKKINSETIESFIKLVQYSNDLIDS